MAVKPIRNTVFARWQIIHRGGRPTNTAPTALVEACRTQSTLAALTMVEFGIVPIALNTLKRVADETLVGGWADLDLQRRKLFVDRKATGKTRSEKRVSKADKSAFKLQELRAELDNLRRGHVVLLRAHEQLLDYMRQLSAENPLVSERLARHEATWDIRRLHFVKEQQDEVR